MSRVPRTPRTEAPPPSSGGRLDDEHWRQFAAAWRRRIEEPPGIPSETAAARVVARLAERDRAQRSLLASPSLWGPVFAAACALALVLSLRLTVPPEIPAEQAGGVLAASAPSTDELVLWLDDETPLHFTLQPSAEVADDVQQLSEGDLR